MIGSFQRFLTNYFREIYFSYDLTVYQRIIRDSLITFVPIYKLLRYINKKYRLKYQTKLDRPVISVGNLSVGGTGKTSFVIYLLEILHEQGFNPAVLKRGEGSKEGIIYAGEEVDSQNIAKEYGDEVGLIVDHASFAHVGISPSREEVARRIQNNEQVDVFIMDDGFQYQLLDRDLDIVLLSDIFELQGWELPAGPLREGPKSLGRADVISVGSDAQIADKMATEYDLNEFIESRTLRCTHRYEFEGIFRNGEEVSDKFRAEPFVLITTLARPGKLEDFLEANDLKPSEHFKLPDHSGLNWDYVRSLTDAENILLTEKEWVKLSPENRKRAGVLKSRFVIDDQDEFRIRITSILTD